MWFFCRLNLDLVIIWCVHFVFLRVCVRCCTLEDLLWWVIVDKRYWCFLLLLFLRRVRWRVVRWDRSYTWRESVFRRFSEEKVRYCLWELKVLLKVIDLDCFWCVGSLFWLILVIFLVRWGSRWFYRVAAWVIHSFSAIFLGLFFWGCSLGREKLKRCWVQFKT